MNTINKTIIKCAEKGYLWSLMNIGKDITSLDYKGFIDDNSGICESAGWGSGIAFTNAIALYLCPMSKYYLDQEVLSIASDYLSNMVLNQNEDGTWDLKGSNFHDATASAFTIEQLISSLHLMKKECSNHKELLIIIDQVEKLLLKAGEALLVGGFHTPNHRWVISAALSYLYAEFKDNKYLNEATKYLNEGIDSHEDGSFSEKSVGNYDAVVDTALLAIAKNFKKNELLDYVEKNLKLILKMIQPDNSIFTYSSFRQDRNMKVNIVKYFLVFKKMYLATGNIEYLNTFYSIYGSDFSLINDSGLNFDFLTDELLSTTPIDFDKEIVLRKGCFILPNLGMARILKENIAITIMKENATLIHIQKGNIELFVRLYSSFFSRGQFKASSFDSQNGKITLSQVVKYGYIRPFSENVETKEWKEMPHGTWANIKLFNTPGLYPKWEEIDSGKRDTVLEQKLDYKLEIEEIENGLGLNFSICGTERVPYKIDFAFTSGGWFSSDEITIKGQNNLKLFSRAKTINYRKGLDSFTINNGFALFHQEELRGEEPFSSELSHLCFTSYTQDERRVEIKWN